MRIVRWQSEEIQPSVIYHCAAYTAVDKAEDEGKELDEKVNVDGTSCCRSC